MKAVLITQPHGAEREGSRNKASPDCDGGSRAPVAPVGLVQPGYFVRQRRRGMRQHPPALSAESVAGRPAPCERPGIPPQGSRQALEAKEKIKEAYLLRRAGQWPTRVVDATEALLRQRVENLKARVSDLEQTLARYDELFLRHHYNAELHGISVAELERPIPKVNKGQTDEEMPEAGRRTGK